MSEENKKQEETAKPLPAQPIKLTDKDFEPALDHLEAAERNLDKYISKPGHNPFIYRNTHIAPLRDRYVNGERTGLLRKEMLAVDKNAVPIVSKGKIETITMKQGDIKTAGVGPNPANGENP